MLNIILAEFYDRDLLKLIDEVNLFNDEQNLWRTAGSVKNPSGNLVLHIVGGLNHRIGTILGQTGYVRDRNSEFTTKGMAREYLVTQLEETILMVNQTLNALAPEEMQAEYPIFFDKPQTSVTYVITQLLLHLNYHLGQVNYLRRVFE